MRHILFMFMSKISSVAQLTDDTNSNIHQNQVAKAEHYDPKKVN